MLPLMLTAALAFQSPPRDAALAAQIPRLFHDISILDDADPKNKAAADEFRRLLARRGLITIAEAGDEASYMFVVQLCDITPVDARDGLLRKARDAKAKKVIPADALAYCEARTRQDRIKTAADRRPPANPALRDEIQKLFVTDQAVREAGVLDAAKFAKVDGEHLGPLTAIFEKHGMPTYAMVGPEAASQFAIMIQHQPADFRRKVLPKLKANVDAGQGDAGTYAMMYDRAATDDGRPQRYGENFVCDAQNLAMHPAPIEDEAHVNERRAFLGRVRLELLGRVIAEVYGPSPCSSLGAK